MYLYVNMYLYVCSCVYVYVYMCEYVYMHCILYMCICMYVYNIHACIYVCRCICMCVCMHVYTYDTCMSSISACLCIYVCTRVYMHIYAHICIYSNHYNADMVVAQASLDLWIALLKSNLQYLCDCHPWHCDVYLTVCFWDFPLSHHERRVSRSACVSYWLCEHGWATWLSWVSISSSSE